MKRHVPVSSSDASKTGMSYMPKEAITPRGFDFTHTDNLPQAGTTSPYKGDVEGNIKIFRGTLGPEAGKDTSALSGLGQVRQLGWCRYFLVLVWCCVVCQQRPRRHCAVMPDHGTVLHLTTCVCIGVHQGPVKQSKETRVVAPVVTVQSMSRFHTKAVDHATVRTALSNERRRGGVTDAGECRGNSTSLRHACDVLVAGCCPPPFRRACWSGQPNSPPSTPCLR